MVDLRTATRLRPVVAAVVIGACVAAAIGVGASVLVIEVGPVIPAMPNGASAGTRIESLQIQAHNLDVGITSVSAAQALQSQAQSLRSQALELTSGDEGGVTPAAVSSEESQLQRELQAAQEQPPNDQLETNSEPLPTPEPSEAPPPTLDFSPDFPHLVPCKAVPHTSTEALNSDSTATRSNIRVFRNVAREMAMTGMVSAAKVGIDVFDATPGVASVKAASEVSDIALETAVYGVDTANADLTADLLTLNKESEEFRKFIDLERQHPKGSPEYSDARRQYDFAIRAHVNDLKERQQEFEQIGASASTWQFIKNSQSCLVCRWPRSRWRGRVRLSIS